MHWTMVSSAPVSAHQMLVAAPNSLPDCDKSKVSSDFATCPLGDRLPPGEYCWFKVKQHVSMVYLPIFV